MRNMWKGLVIGAVAGMVTGAELDRRAARGASAAHHVPSGSQLRDGLSGAADRLKDVEVPSSLADVAATVRERATKSAAGAKDAAGTVREAAGTVREAADTVREKATKTAAGAKEAATTARSSLTGS